MHVRLLLNPTEATKMGENARDLWGKDKILRAG